jgi:hypothetical protein
MKSSAPCIWLIPERVITEDIRGVAFIRQGPRFVVKIEGDSPGPKLERGEVPVKFSRRLSAYLCLVIMLCCAIAAASPWPKDKEKEKEQSNIDSGSFGVYMNGHRVGTEKFLIQQTNNGSSIKSEFKTENDQNNALQQSTLELTGNGDIRRYEWKELSPGQAQSSIIPNNEFLNQKWSAGPGDKEHEQPYLLPHSTTILDDYFFIHREVLVWRFLAVTCKQEKGQVQCPIKQRSQFGTLDPRQHASSPLSAEFLGREKITYKGNQQEFNKVEFKTETGPWQLWLDDEFKVMRIVIEGDNTEVLRD